MEQSKSPKSCAYARLGKQISGKHSVPEEHTKKIRNSTGNIYQQILRQFDSEQGKYIRSLVHKNQKAQDQSPSTVAIHTRKKSYADVEPAIFKKEQKQKPQNKRQQRQTLIKSKKPQNILVNQGTPKHNAVMTRSDFVDKNQMYQSANLSSFIKKEEKKEEKGFLDNLNNYLETLNETVDHVSHVGGHFGRASIPAQKFAQTLKFPPNPDSYSIASKLQKAMIKIKQYKLKNHYLEKQLTRYGKRERKMKECLYEMLEQLRHTNNELTKQKKQRKRLEKVIDSFELQNSKPQRKTIGKHYNLSKIQQFEQQINLFTQNQISDLESSRDIWRPNFPPAKTKQHDRQYSHVNRGMMDSRKLDQLFKSGFHSEEDSYDG